MQPTPFQKSSANHIVKKLTKATATTRFLLADEPGLGKTVVAREVINQMRQAKSPRQHLRVVYICSNMGIIDQNIDRLHPDGSQPGQDEIRHVRLTTWPAYLSRTRRSGGNNNRIEIVSFTPQTSLYMSRSAGIYTERIYLLSVIRAVFELNETFSLREIFRAQVGSNLRTPEERDTRWSELIRRNSKLRIEDEALANRYRRFFEDNKTKYSITFSRIEQLRKLINEGEDIANDEIREFLKQGRTALAQFALEDLNPDLIILDEFQNFRTVLEDAKDPETIVGQLLGDSARKLLLLSATPYKMYTVYEDTPDKEHYEQFTKTLEFLTLGKDEQRHAIISLLDNYRQMLFSAKQAPRTEILSIKTKAEAALKDFMIRTERVSFLNEIDGGVVEVVPDNDGSFRLHNGTNQDRTIDLISNQALEEVKLLAQSAVAHNYSRSSAIAYWKSGSFLPNIMGENDYELVRSLERDPQIWRADSKELLDISTEVQYGNRHIEYLSLVLFDEWKLHRYLWIPPSLSRMAGAAHAGKMLLFSHWRFVPRYASLCLSLEAARRIEKETISAEVGDNSNRNLLQFKSEQYSVFFVCYPSYWLASIVTPHEVLTMGEEKILELARERIRVDLRKKGRLDIEQRRRLRINELVPKMIAFDTLEALDLGNERMSTLHLSLPDEESEEGEEEEFEVYRRLAEDFTSFSTDKQKRQFQFSENEIAVLARVCVKSPGVAFCRAVMTEWSKNDGQIDKPTDDHILRLSLTALRRFFDRPYARKIIRRSGRDETAYWEDVLNYCYSFEWQHAIQEYVYLLTNQYGVRTIEWPADEPRETEILNDFFEELSKVMKVLPGKVRFRTSRNKYEDVRVHFALPFSDMESDSRLQRAETIRLAFNSPFYPFVLSTTSVGQEGIDFHRYCADVYHWNLPSNPVDLEQREGRVNRYDGLVVRKNIARFNVNRIDTTQNSCSMWGTLIRLAEDDEQGNPLSPHWVYKMDHPESNRIRRHVVLLPFSSDRRHFIALKRTLAYYRIAFGQPRQADLVDHVMRNPAFSDYDIRSLYLDLRPDKDA